MAVLTASWTGRPWRGSCFWSGPTWRAEPGGVVVRHVPLAKRAVAAIAAEGRRLGVFSTPVPDVRLEPVSR